MTATDEVSTPPRRPGASADLIIGDARTTIVLGGELDGSIHEHLRQLVADAISTRRPIRVDLHNVRSLCPATVDLLVDLAARAPRGATVVRPTGRVRASLLAGAQRGLLSVADR